MRLIGRVDLMLINDSRGSHAHFLLHRSKFERHASHQNSGHRALHCIVRLAPETMRALYKSEIRLVWPAQQSRLRAFGVARTAALH